jgi:hypothetical protein
MIDVSLNNECISDQITLYIKVEDEVHDATNLTINDPTFELCGMNLVNTSLVDLSNTDTMRIWSYTFAVEKTSNRTISQLLIKVTEANEGPNTSTSPFSVTRLLQIEVKPPTITYTGSQQSPDTETINFQITDPKQLLLEVRDKIEQSIVVTTSDVIGDVTSYDCDPLNMQVQVQLSREIYPCFFDKDCSKFLFNYKRVDDMSWCPLNSFDPNLITSDIGINTLTYRVIDTESGNPIEDSSGDIIEITKVLQFNPVIHIQESHVTIPEGSDKYDSSSNLNQNKGDVIECLYEMDSSLNEAKADKKYTPKTIVVVWKQGAKPDDTEESDYRQSMDVLTTTKYFIEHDLINFNVEAYDLVQSSEDEKCLDLSLCDSSLNIPYEDFKLLDYATMVPDCSASSPVLQVTLNFSEDIIATHVWSEASCNYVPANLTDDVTVNPSLLSQVSKNVTSRYIYFREDDTQIDLNLEYNGTPDENNSLVIDDLVIQNESKTIDVKYGNENTIVCDFEVKQSLTKYPEGQQIRQTPIISQINPGQLTINNSKPHEFIVKVTALLPSSRICELSGCLTTTGKTLGQETVTEMFSIELAYNEPTTAKLYLDRGESVRKFTVTSGPSGNQIDEGIIYDLFTQTDTGVLYPGLKYNDPVIGTYFLNDDYIQHSVYVNSVKLVTGEPANTSNIVIQDNLGLSVLLKDYKLTHDKLVAAGLADGCLPNDLLGFRVGLNYNTLAANDHNDGDSRNLEFFFYHSNTEHGFTVTHGVTPNSETQQAICIQFVVAPFAFKDYETQLLTKCLRHNPNFRNTNVGTGTPDPDDILVQGTETYTQYDTLYVTPRLAESDGSFNADWLDTPVQHDNGLGKAEYNTGLHLCFTTNYGNNFVMQAVDMSNGATNVTQFVNHNYEFNGECLQITNVDTSNIIVDVSRSTQDPLFRYEIGDITDPTKLTSERNAAIDITYDLSYTDFQGFPHEISQEFKWDISLCSILEPTLHMDSVQKTLMDDEYASLCRPFWMRSEEFGGWIKHAYERKLMQDITDQEAEPLHAEIDANNEVVGLDSSMVPYSHMHIDNQGEFHTQYGERVWVDSITVDASNCPNQSITLNGKGVNVVGMEATASVSVDVSLVCEQEAPEFIGELNHCVSVAQSDALLQAIIDGSGSEHLQSLIDLQVKYWNATAYWESNEYLESEYADPNKVEEDSVVNNDHEAVDFQKLTELSPEDVYTYDKSYIIDPSGLISVTYKPYPTATSYVTENVEPNLSNLVIPVNQISVYTIPLIKVDEPECEGAPQKETTTIIQINVQDPTKPVAILANQPRTANVVGSAPDQWLSQDIVVSHDRYVVEFAHYITEGYVWDKLTEETATGEHCISIRELLAPTPLAYEATSEQLASSTMIRDTSENSLKLNADVTGVESGCCGPIYHDSYVTHVEFVSDRNNDTIDINFNDNSFTGTSTIDTYNSSELNVPVVGKSGQYVITLTDSTHVLGDCTDVVGTGSTDGLSGELIIVESNSSLWNQTGLTDDQPFMAIATHNKQEDHRFTSLRILERDVNMKYPACGTVRVASRSIMPSNMTPECEVTVTNCNDLEFKSTLSDELLGGYCGLAQGNVIIDDQLVNDTEIERISVGCDGQLVNGTLSPVAFANVSGILTNCDQLSFTVDASQCIQSRYTEYDETTDTRIACDEPLGISVTYEPVPIPGTSNTAYIVIVDGQPYVLENQIFRLELVSKLVDYELFCRSFCTNVFTGSYNSNYIKLMGSGDENDSVCDANDSLTRVIELQTCVVPQLSIVGRPNNSLSASVTQPVPDNNTHFSDADWNTFLNVEWNVAEELKVDASGNSNIRVLIREILVEGTSHYQGDVNNVHLVYDQKQLISDVIANSHKIDSDADLTRLFNNELEAGNASTLRIDANPGEEINVSYMVVAFMGEYIAVSDIKTINYNITTPS